MMLKNFDEMEQFVLAQPAPGRWPWRQPTTRTPWARC